MSQQDTLYQNITNQIIEAIESGLTPWVKPWTNNALGSPFPHNVVSRSHYHGINILLLNYAQMKAEYPTASWLTFKQVQKKGGYVRKGERGQVVCFWKFFKRGMTDASGAPVNDEHGNQRMASIPMLKTYYVFNIAQCEDLEIPAPKPVPELVPTELYQRIERTGATITHGGDTPCYRPATDDILCPRPDLFCDEDNYHATLLHELTHWSGGHKRLDRDLSGRFGTESYAAEELIAEIGSAFLCGSLGVPLDGLQHPAYVENWLKVLRNDNRAIFTASRHAQTASDYLLDLMSNQQQEAA